MELEAYGISAPWLDHNVSRPTTLVFAWRGGTRRAGQYLCACSHPMLDAAALGALFTPDGHACCQRHLLKTFFFRMYITFCRLSTQAVVSFYKGGRKIAKKTHKRDLVKAHGNVSCDNNRRSLQVQSEFFLPEFFIRFFFV